MHTRRPLECPACGYDRVRRLAPGTTWLAAPPRQQWECRLCSYVWQVATPDREEPATL